jgi:hypothetical protein
MARPSEAQVRIVMSEIERQTKDFPTELIIILSYPLWNSFLPCVLEITTPPYTSLQDCIHSSCQVLQSLVGLLRIDLSIALLEHAHSLRNQLLSA